MKFRGHVLLWANEGKRHYQPKFIRESNDATKIANFMEEYINTVITYYKGKTYAWDVVNEYIAKDGTKRTGSAYA